MSGVAFDLGFGVDIANQIYDIGQALDEGLIANIERLNSVFTGFTGFDTGGFLSEKTVTLANSIGTSVSNLFSILTSLDTRALGNFDFASLFGDLLTGLSSARIDIINLASGIVATLGESFVNLVQSSEFQSSVLSIGTTIVDTLGAGLAIAISEGAVLAQAVGGLVLSLGTAIISASGALAGVGAELITGLFPSDFSPVDLLQDFFSGLGDLRIELINRIPPALTGIVDSLDEFAKSGVLLEGISTVTTALVDAFAFGLSSAFSENAKLGEGAGAAMGQIALQLGRAGLIITTQLFAIGGQIVADIGAGILSALTGGEITTSTATELDQLFSDIGKLSLPQLLEFGIALGVALWEGLVSGLTSGIATVTEAVFSFASGIAHTFAEFFGIASPSTVFAEFGLNLIQGLVLGITENAAAVGQALSATVGQGLASAGEALSLPDLGLSELFGGGDTAEGDGEGIGLGAIGDTVAFAGEAIEEASDIIQSVATPAFESVQEAAGGFGTEANNTANALSSQLVPAFSRLSSTVSSAVNPSLTTAESNTLQMATISTKLATVLNKALNPAALIFAEYLDQIASNAENALEPLTELKNILAEIASFLVQINGSGSSSGAVGNAQAAGGTAAGIASGGFQSFSDVRTNSTVNNFNLSVSSAQSSGGLVSDFGRMMALA